MRQSSIGRRSALVGAGSLLAAPAIVRAQGQNGVALVIGNSKYHWEAQLPNVRRDAPDIAKRFQAMGLKTELIQDANGDAMRRAIDSFGAASRGVNLSAFYFAGHGAFATTNTRIVPVDTDLSSPSVADKLTSVNSIADAMSGASNRLLVFDSCRNSPADGWRQRDALDNAGTTSIAQRQDVDRNRNMVILFSTSPGRVALDGPPGDNSPFAAAVLRQLGGQSVDLQALPGNIRREVLLATEGRQVVWDRSTYQKPFVISGQATNAPASRSGWNQDPSRIVELTNAYAYARENGLLLAPGFIAHRPAATSADGTKVGSYKYAFPGPQGLAPSLFVVMSVEDQNAVEIIIASKTSSDGTTGWSLNTGTLSGSKLEPATRASWGMRLVFNWSDANSGSVGAFYNGGRPPYGGRFTRLDG